MDIGVDIGGGGDSGWWYVVDGKTGLVLWRTGNGVGGGGGGDGV